jgi:uncharacterized membrane protein YphA (DoxX/SURF4 family)
MQRHTTFQEASLLILRFVLAAIFLYAGVLKFGFWSAPPEGMPMGMINLMRFLAVVETVGAIAVLVGFLTRWASAGLGIIMVGAIFMMQFTMGVGFVTAQGAGWNFPLAVLACSVPLMAFGPGCWSVDAVWGKQ